MFAVGVGVSPFEYAAQGCDQPREIGGGGLSWHGDGRALPLGVTLGAAREFANLIHIVSAHGVECSRATEGRGLCC